MKPLHGIFPRQSCRDAETGAGIDRVDPLHTSTTSNARPACTRRPRTGDAPYSPARNPAANRIATTVFESTISPSWIIASARDSGIGTASRNSSFSRA